MQNLRNQIYSSMWNMILALSPILTFIFKVSPMIRMSFTYNTILALALTMRQGIPRATALTNYTRTFSPTIMPPKIEGDQFYIEGDPGPDDQFYIQDYEEPDLFYFIELFTVGEELQFYIVNDENYEESGFVIVSDFDPGRHDWRSELTDSGEHFIEVSEAIEDMMIDLENLQLTPGEIQTDQDSWVITFEDY